MKYFSAMLFLCFGIAGSVSSQDIDLTFELCEQENVQTSCQTSCANACNDASFLKDNTSYCLENGLIGVQISPKPDAARCIGIFQPEAEETQELIDANAATSNPGQCDQLKTRSEQRRCELTQLTPQCSPTVVELEGRARLLVTEISLEVAQYGELLKRDWTDIDNRDALCRFSISELDENYQVASDNPALLRALQRQGTGIQSCQSEWEKWLRDNAGTRGSDSFIDRIARESEAQLGPLKEQIERLGSSVKQLESATDTIGEIIDVHIFFCDPEGTPTEQQETD